LKKSILTAKNQQKRPQTRKIIVREQKFTKKIP